MVFALISIFLMHGVCVKKTVENYKYGVAMCDCRLYIVFCKGRKALLHGKKLACVRCYGYDAA